MTDLPLPHVAETVRRMRGALRPAESRAALLSAARHEARMVHGRERFVWRERVLTVGLPLGAAVATAVWHSGRRRPRRALSAAVGAALAAVAVSYVGALVEWELFERSYRRETGRDV